MFNTASHMWTLLSHLTVFAALTCDDVRSLYLGNGDASLSCCDASDPATALANVPACTPRRGFPVFSKAEYDSLDLSGRTLTTGYAAYTMHLFGNPFAGNRTLCGVYPTMVYLLSQLTKADIIVENDPNWQAPNKVKSGEYDFIASGYMFNTDYLGPTSTDVGSIWEKNLNYYLVCKTADKSEFEALLANANTPAERLSALRAAGKKLIGDMQYTAYSSQSVYSTDDSLFVDVSYLSDSAMWGQGLADGSIDGDFYMVNQYGLISGLSRIKTVNSDDAPVYKAVYGTGYVNTDKDPEVTEKLTRAMNLIVSSGLSQAVHEYWNALHVELVNDFVDIGGRDLNVFGVPDSSAFGNIKQIYDSCNRHRSISRHPNLIPEIGMINSHMIITQANE